MKNVNIYFRIFLFYFAFYLALVAAALLLLLLRFNLNVNLHEMNQLSRQTRSGQRERQTQTQRGVCVMRCAVKLCIRVCSGLGRGFACVCACMKINWSAVRNKMLLGEQLLDEVQVVAVLGQLERREQERQREGGLQNSGHNIKYLDSFFTQPQSSYLSTVATVNSGRRGKGRGQRVGKKQLRQE